MISDAQWAELMETRATRPAAIAEALAARASRPLLADDGNTFIIAVDHPARRANGVGADPFAMANRHDLINRTVTALADPGCDGIMGTPDIIDDLALLGALDGKVAIGSMNRGGLQGTAWELDDQLTGHDATAVVEQGLDGGKMLLRIDPENRDSRPTIEACAEFIAELAVHKKVAMVEPLPYTTRDGKAVLSDSADELVRCVGVASALGSSSAYTWLKLPASDEIERVMAATSLPGLILGGAPGPEPESAFDEWQRAMAVANVRGLVVGRSLLYPPDGDVMRAVATAAEIVHPG